MFRRLVLMGVFFASLPVLLLLAKVQGNDPPQKQAIVADDPFADAGAKPDKPKPAIEANTVRKQPSSPKLSKPGPKIDSVGVADDDAAERRIRDALASPTTIEFVETPFKDFVEYLRDLHHIQIQLDSPAFKDAGIDESVNVTKSLRGISLGSALKLILDELQLKYVVHHGVLIITTPAKAESEEYMGTRFFPVEDLVAIEGDGSVNVQPLSDLLVNSVASKSWVDNGGMGTVSGFVVGNRVLLVVSQSEEVCEQIEKTLEKLRKIAAAKKTAVDTVDFGAAKVLRLKQPPENHTPAYYGAGSPPATEAGGMKADERQKENIEKRIEFLNSQIAATEKSLSHSDDPASRAALLQEYCGEVKALKDLIEARAALKGK
jgi:hypothetical protein